MEASTPTRTTIQRLFAAAITALAVMAAILATAQPATAGTVEDEARLFELTNQTRAQHGLAALAYDSAAVGVARAWAQELARSGNLRHNPNLVAQVDAHVTNQWSRLGENVGYAGSIDSVHNAYLNSAPHRANILGDYNRVGVGAARDATGRVWTTVVFIKGPALAAAPAVPNSAFAPFSSAQAFAAQQFVDILGRQADPAGLNAWTAALQSGAASQASMVANLVASPEAGTVVDPVNRLYLAYFRRSPDAGGMAYWVGRVRGGTSLGQISSAFAGSAEFRGTYGSLSDRAFVDLVYRNVLGRSADAAGLDYWIGQLAARRLDRGGVMVNFSESAEFRSMTAKWGDVVHLWVGLLRRAPDQATVDGLLAQLRSGKTLTDLAHWILASTEYKSRRF